MENEDKTEGLHVIAEADLVRWKQKWAEFHDLHYPINLNLSWKVFSTGPICDLQATDKDRKRKDPNLIFEQGAE